MKRKAAATKAKRAKVEPTMNPDCAYIQGEKLFHRHEYGSARLYFSFAAGRGVSKAWGKLSVIYHRGLGVNADHDLARLAIKAARIAAELETRE